MHCFPAEEMCLQLISVLTTQGAGGFAGAIVLLFAPGYQDGPVSIFCFAQKLTLAGIIVLEISQQITLP